MELDVYNRQLYESSSQTQRNQGRESNSKVSLFKEWGYFLGARESLILLILRLCFLSASVIDFAIR